MKSNIKSKNIAIQNAENVEIKRSRPNHLNLEQTVIANNDLDNIIDNTEKISVENTLSKKTKNEAHIGEVEKVKIIFTAILNKHLNGKKKVVVNDIISLISLSITLVSKTIAEIPKGEIFDEEEIVEIIYDMLKPTNDMLYKNKYISKDTYDNFKDDIEILEYIEPLIVNFLSMSSHIVSVFANKNMWKKYCCC